MGTWGAPRSSETYGFIDLDVTETEGWCAERTGVSIAHVIGAAVSRALAAVPDANSRIVFGRVMRRTTVDVSYVLDVDRGSDLTAVCVRDADQKSPREVAREVFAVAREIRRGRDPEFGRIRRAATLLPPGLRRPLLAAGGVVTSGLGIAVRPARVRAFPFGAIMISSVGALGLERGLAPLVPLARTSMILVIGSASWRPRVVDGEVRPRRVVELGMTMDHRLLDGAQVGELAARVRADSERPWEAWPDADSPRSG